MQLVDRLLRGEREFAAGRGASPLAAIAGTVLLFGAAHGAMIGTFSLRAEQALYSAVKLPLLIALSSVLCVPSFYALNSVMGLRDDFSAALRGVLCTQATVAVVLCSLAPLVLLGYASSDSYRSAVFVNGLAFCVASLCGQRTLARHYRPLVARNRRHALGCVSWLALSWFVTIQLAWILRPFVGDPNLAPTFLRPHAWSNAYVVLAKTFLRW